MDFVNFPSYITIEQYRENIEKYTSHVMGFSEVLGLFSMGGLSTPGLSDIDLIVVVKNKIASGDSLSPFDLDLDNRLFLHNVFIVHPLHVNEFNYILYATNVHPLYIANDINMSFPTAEFLTKELKLIYLIELGIMRLNQLCAISQRGKCNVRMFLTRVSSIIHSVDIAMDLEIDLPDSVVVFRNDIVSIRKRWAEQKGTLIENVEQIFERGIQSCCRILEASAKRLNYMDSFIQLNQPFRSRCFGIHFSDNNQCYIKKDGKGRFLRPYFPQKIYHHYTGYMLKNNDKYHLEQKKRLNLVKRHRSFLKKNRFTYSMSGNLGFPLNKNEFISFLFDEIRNFFTVTPLNFS